ncbi:MAG: c-type cytochrome [Betaproteobacteria bacterium]|jgi:cytochrome c553|nr:cytochrome c [Rhodocyclaceae bacterium]MCA3133035.1 cytochrome c [Rhodocyclaceae bacterium]MCA3141886.1 cytochrome c [Rhodocyclaceae bacterium]MCA3144794.1 cytochrome c [Rhodocyclaceae bacterium]MCE2896626.1 cytochrome c [Betaproteobacteria bacterium]
MKAFFFANPFSLSSLLAGVLGAAALAASLPANAGGNAAAGEKKAETCAACHGPGGAKPATPDYPVLAGQHADYLRQALTAYQKGKRKNAIMSGMAAPLSKQDIADLAAYFASQKSLTDKY